MGAGVVICDVCVKWDGWVRSVCVTVLPMLQVLLPPRNMMHKLKSELENPFEVRSTPVAFSPSLMFPRPPSFIAHLLPLLISSLPLSSIYSPLPHPFLSSCVPSLLPPSPSLLFPQSFLLLPHCLVSPCSSSVPPPALPPLCLFISLPPPPPLHLSCSFLTSPLPLCLFSVPNLL